MQESPLSPTEQGAANVVSGMVEGGKMAGGAALKAGNQLYESSAPHIAQQILKKIKGEPNELEKVPQNAVMTFLGFGGVPEADIAEAGAATPAAAAEAAPTVRGALKPGQYEAPASPLTEPKQLGSGVIDGEYLDEPQAAPKPAIANLPSGAYEQRGGFEPNQPALPAKQAIQLPARFPEQQAREELGPDAPLSKVVARAQEIKIAPPATEATDADEARVPSSESMPRTLSGESALRQVLTGQDNANLLKIARSRGINITKESQLRPGFADNLLINKIVNDFSEDELSNMRDTFLEARRNRHQFGDIGSEAWKTMSLQTYFPELKISAAQVKRVQGAIAAGETPAASSAGDLTDLLKKSLDATKKKKP